MIWNFAHRVHIQRELHPLEDGEDDEQSLFAFDWSDEW
jgi:hypothetical protein